MNDPRVPSREVRRAAARAAASYDEHDGLAREVEARLFDSLAYYEGQPTRVLDVGCGTGRGTALLKKHWRHAEVIALDLALPMLRRARRHGGWRRRLHPVCADARALPFPDHSVDAVYSNLYLPWCDEPRALFREFARVLRPGGFMVASSFGPDTLIELRAAWADADPDHPHVGPFTDMHDLGDAALAAGLKDPVLDTDHITTTYADVHGLLAGLRGTGATNVHPGRARGLAGKARFRAMLAAYEAYRRDGRIPATWEVVTLHAWAFPAGAMPLYGGRETPFEVISRRAPRRHD